MKEAQRRRQNVPEEILLEGRFFHEGTGEIPSFNNRYVGRRGGQQEIDNVILVDGSYSSSDVTVSDKGEIHGGSLRILMDCLRSEEYKKRNILARDDILLRVPPLREISARA